MGNNQSRWKKPNPLEYTFLPLKDTLVASYTEVTSIAIQDLT